MTDTQFITLAVAPLATLLVVILGVLFNNSRLSDLRTSQSDRLGEMRTSFSERLNDVRDVLRAESGKNHSELLVKIAELDQRLSRLEQQRMVQ